MFQNADAPFFTASVDTKTSCVDSGSLLDQVPLQKLPAAQINFSYLT